MDTIRKKYDEGFKRHVVSEIESGRLSQADATKEYELTKSLVRCWLVEYGRFRPMKSIVEVVMKSEEEKIAELQKALAEAHLKLRVYDEILDQAGKRYKVDLKKSFGTAQSESSPEKSTKSKRSVKR